MSDWKEYQKTALWEMRPYVPNEDLNGISVSDYEIPRKGGMIARNPKNHSDQWYVACDFFRENYAPAERDAALLQQYVDVANDLVSKLAASVKREMVQQKRIAELEKQIQKTRDNFYAADRLNIETQKTTTVQFSAMISRYVDQCGDQQERIADLERQIEIGDEALTMLQENLEADIEKVKAEAARLKAENGFLKARLERYEGEDHNAGGDDG